jgi:hypothetical protein
MAKAAFFASWALSDCGLTALHIVAPFSTDVSGVPVGPMRGVCSVAGDMLTRGLLGASTGDSILNCRVQYGILT